MYSRSAKGGEKGDSNRNPWLAKMLVDMPALNIPKAWLRSLLLKRGIFETQ
jgi:hypothetical protein